MERRADPGPRGPWLLLVVGLVLGIGLIGVIASGARLPATSEAPSPSPSPRRVVAATARPSAVRAEVPAGSTRPVGTARAIAAPTLDPGAWPTATHDAGAIGEPATAVPAATPARTRSGFPTARPARTPATNVEATLAVADAVATGRARIRFDYPRDGATVSSRFVNVIGHAPPGVLVVRVTPAGIDGTMVARPDGLWLLRVELQAGPNRLTFRLGDDDSTAATITVSWRPG